MYKITKICEEDYYKGYLQLLEQLTTVEANKISYEDKFRAELVIVRILKLSANSLDKLLDMKVRAHVSWMKKEKLEIEYQYGMDKDMDRYIKLPAGFGCMGFTWAKVVANVDTKSTLCDFNIKIPEGAPQWLLPPEEEKKVKKGLKWIYTSPLIVEIVLKNQKNTLQLIGLLTYDSISALGEEQSHKDKQIKIIETISENVAYNIAEILQEFREIPTSIIVGYSD